MDYFDDPYWNIHQVIAWVYTGDRALVGEVAHDAPAGTVWEEHLLPNGDRELVEVESDPRHPLNIRVAAALNGGTATSTWKVAVDQILRALRAGAVTALGVRNDQGSIQVIEPYEWADMQFYFKPDIAAPADLLRSSANRWYRLKFKRDEVLNVWPDPFTSNLDQDDIRGQSADDGGCSSSANRSKKAQRTSTGESKVNLSAPAHSGEGQAANADNATPTSGVGSPNWRRASGKKAVEARHNQPGGSREKRQRIQDIWASGKYSSRDRCAEEECAALDMSFTAARKALRNTPDPDRTT